ncbi:uncharacterized protein LOC120643645 [Panicum virgatum]|uniref:Uncharacterized protein n=1 Tax=Panicum virgatum TaxID=38727 RepID=A0A8T0PQ23_PANVG|nr:uncharacterized protein LOC120643645 [Panicum virgatum]XP_039775999.1 uncharacterized protein LOC120643645 [Panicum virgatum]XP_039776001.1 uncharacterized protein LOC120643645 [Panicum virgatum]KAG2560232.1 hypothetical protein PVAP13_8KG071500 [Panicum virgatum]KAG2560233.1 hypothetical protein PVAP13_8KG071500 [Panicum virgatum]KAG2560234.1 hypothetical protein PVAP13_8KG071500 [Panicum virgatum]
MACHQRSTSLPSFSYSTELNVEQELQTLKAQTSSPSATIGTACDGLRRLGDVYSCIEEMMCLPSNQALTGQRKMVEEELEKSLVLIDLCNTMQESLAELKTSVQELCLVLKRRDSVAAQLKIKSFVRLAKKTQKPLKKTTSKATAEVCSCRVVKLLAEGRETAVSLLETTSLLLALLPKQIGSPIASKWSLVSKKFQKTRVICEEQQLQALEHSIGDLEDGIEFLFTRLIQSRVTVLNILSS